MSKSILNRINDYLNEAYQLRGLLYFRDNLQLIKYKIYFVQEMTLSLTRSHLHQLHDLSDGTLASHPDPTGRILYFALPFLFAVITSLSLYARNLRIHQNNFIRTYPSSLYILLAVVITIVGEGVIGVYAILTDAWTVKEWILFAVICVLVGLKALIYTADTNPTLLITAIVTLLLAATNEWLFSELRDLAEKTQDQIGWKHVTRNIVGFAQAFFVILAVEYLSESLVYVFKVSLKGASVFFWIFSLLGVGLLLVWNILTYGPFLDQIGYIAAALILFLGAVVNTLFHKDQDGQRRALNK